MSVSVVSMNRDFGNFNAITPGYSGAIVTPDSSRSGSGVGSGRKQGLMRRIFRTFWAGGGGDSSASKNKQRTPAQNSPESATKLSYTTVVPFVTADDDDGENAATSASTSFTGRTVAPRSRGRALNISGENSVTMLASPSFIARLRLRVEATTTATEEEEEDDEDVDEPSHHRKLPTNGMVTIPVTAFSDPNKHADFLWTAEQKRRKAQMLDPIQGLLRANPSVFRLDVQRQRINGHAHRSIASQFRTYLFRQRLGAFTAFLRLVDDAPARGVEQAKLMRALEVGASAEQLANLLLGLPSSTVDANVEAKSDGVHTQYHLDVLTRRMSHGVKGNIEMRQRIGERILAAYVKAEQMNKKKRVSDAKVAMRTAQSCVKFINRSRANAMRRGAFKEPPKPIYAGIIDDEPSSQVQSIATPEFIAHSRQDKTRPAQYSAKADENVIQLLPGVLGER